MTMPPFAEDPEDSRRTSPPGASWPPTHGLPRAVDGHPQDYAVAQPKGATIVRIGSTLYTLE